MTAREWDELAALVRAQLGERVAARAEDSILGCILRTPFMDHFGDPINLAISKSEGTFVIDDTGVVAGHLFSLGQHPVDTPAFKLLKSLADAYRLRIDYNEGLIRTEVAPEDFFEGVMNLTKVIVTVVTALPHMRVSPHRLKLLGPRVRTRIKQRYEARQILNLVEAGYEIRGLSVDTWPVDFHWSVRADREVVKDVFVVAVDLDVSDPLRKAERVAALAVDASEQLVKGDLRIVFDRHGANSGSETAARFLRSHSRTLRFHVFDFGSEEEEQRFVDMSVRELLGEAGQPWREFWVTRAQGPRHGP